MNNRNLLIGLEEYTESMLIKNLRKTIEKFPEIDFSDCMSRNQIKSKKWLVSSLKSHLSLNFNSIFVLCGWYGILPAMLADDKELNIKKIRSIDIDDHCVPIADSMNKDWLDSKWKFKAFCKDILKY